MPKGVITNVNKLRQGEFTVFTFPLSAITMTKLGVISRLHENEGGVQRKLNEDRAAEIAMAMQNPEILWLDSFLVHMEPPGTWEFNEEARTITYRDGFTLSIDDGQHRRYALETLNPEELARLNQFSVTATHDLSFDQRLKLFLQQEKRKHIDRNLQLRARYHLGDWKRPIDKEAYDVILALASDPRSPLCGKIQVEEVTKTEYSGQYRLSCIPATGLFATLRSVLGQRSILYGFPPQKQTDIIIRYLNVAATLWREQWDNPEEYFLSGTRGANVLLRLLVSSNSLRVILTNNDFADLRLKNALSLATGFNWSFERNRNKPDKLILAELDKTISRKYKTRLRERNQRRGETD